MYPFDIRHEGCLLILIKGAMRTGSKFQAVWLVHLMIVFSLLLAGCEDRAKYNRSGDILRAQKQYDNALIEYEKTIRDFPGSKEAKEAKAKIIGCILDWGDLKFRQTKFEEAADLYERIFKEHTESPVSMTNIPSDHKYFKELSKAAKGYQEAIILGAKEGLEFAKFDYASRLLKRGEKLKDIEQFYHKLMYHYDLMGKLAFSSGNHVYICNPDGSGIQKVIRGIWPRLSPDGKKIVYINPRVKKTKGSLHYYDLETKEDKVLFSAPVSFQPFWLPSGDKVLVNKGTLFQIVSIDFKYKKTQYNMGFDNSFEVLSDISPDGKTYIAITRCAAANKPCITKVAGDFSSFTVLQCNLGEKNLNIYDARWSPDGSKVAYASDDGIYFLEVVAGNTLRLLDYGSKDYRTRSLAWSPTGQVLAFTSERKNEDGSINKGIYFVNLRQDVVQLELDEKIIKNLDTRCISWSRGYLHDKE